MSTVFLCIGFAIIGGIVGWSIAIDGTSLRCRRERVEMVELARRLDYAAHRLQRSIDDNTPKES
jgi:hypothetical protein